MRPTPPPTNSPNVAAALTAIKRIDDAQITTHKEISSASLPAREAALRLINDTSNLKIIAEVLSQQLTRSGQTDLLNGIIEALSRSYDGSKQLAIKEIASATQPAKNAVVLLNAAASHLKMMIEALRQELTSPEQSDIGKELIKSLTLSYETLDRIGLERRRPDFEKLTVFELAQDLVKTIKLFVEHADIGKHLSKSVDQSYQMLKKLGVERPRLGSAQFSTFELTNELVAMVSLLCEHVQQAALREAADSETIKSKDRQSAESLAKLTTELSAHEATQTLLKSSRQENTDLQNDNHTLTSTQAETAAALSAKLKELEDLSHNLDAVQRSNTSLEEQLAAAQDTIAQQQEKHGGLQQQLSALTQANQALQRRFDSSRGPLEDLLSTLDTDVAICSFLDQSNITADAKLSLAKTLIIETESLKAVAARIEELSEQRDQRASDALLSLVTQGLTETNAWGQLKYITDELTRVLILQSIDGNAAELAALTLIQSGTAQPPDMQALLKHDNLTSDIRLLLTNRLLPTDAETALFGAVASCTERNAALNRLKENRPSVDASKQNFMNELRQLKLQDKATFEAVCQLSKTFSDVSDIVKNKICDKLLALEVDENGFNDAIDTYPNVFVILIRSVAEIDKIRIGN